jgi:VanZ family protein
MILFIVWMSALFGLSSISLDVPEEVSKMPHFDKIAHFGYFFGGGIILSTWLMLQYDDKKIPVIRKVFIRFVLPIVFFSLIGAIDEYRQTFVPGRTGNDLYDWLADFLGGTCGVILANSLYPLHKKFGCRPRSPWKSY